MEQNTNENTREDQNAREGENTPQNSEQSANLNESGRLAETAAPSGTQQGIGQDEQLGFDSHGPTPRGRRLNPELLHFLDDYLTYIEEVEDEFEDEFEDEVETQRQEEQQQQERQRQRRSESGLPEVFSPRRSERLRVLRNAGQPYTNSPDVFLLRHSERLHNLLNAGQRRTGSSEVLMLRRSERIRNRRRRLATNVVPFYFLRDQSTHAWNNNNAREEVVRQESRREEDYNPQEQPPNLHLNEDFLRELIAATTAPSGTQQGIGQDEQPGFDSHGPTPRGRRNLLSRDQNLFSTLDYVLNPSEDSDDEEEISDNLMVSLLGFIEAIRGGDDEQPSGSSGSAILRVSEVETQRQEEQQQQERQRQRRSESGSPEVFLPRRSERLRDLANIRQQRRSDLLRRSERLRNQRLRLASNAVPRNLRPELTTHAWNDTNNNNNNTRGEVVRQESRREEDFNTLIAPPRAPGIQLIEEYEADFQEQPEVEHPELFSAFFAPYFHAIMANIDYYTERHSYQPSDGEGVCVICQEDFVVGGEIRKLKCNHFFHTECTDNWFRYTFPAKCPICRQHVTAGAVNRSAPSHQ